jgi:pyruvate dehydrogenase E2 component (dihydrolipoamide acetyltransferase)
MPIEVTMPALSPTMTEGNLAKWHKKQGDSVAAGDVIAEIETDKATMEVEAVDEGVIGKLLVAEGTEGVAVNAVIALLLEEGEAQSAADNYKIKQPEVAKVEAETPAQEGAKSDAAPAAVSAAPAGAGFTAPPSFVPPKEVGVVAKSSDRVKASPLAKRLAEEKGLDVGALVGTGPHGRVVKDDVDFAIRSGGLAAHVVRNPQEVSAQKNDNMRKIIATRLLQSKQHVPHFYLTVECHINKLLDVRKDLNAAAAKDENGKPVYKVSVNDMVIKASAKALKEIPEANASWTDEAIYLYNNVDVSVAVAIEGGLVTPIVRNADQKSLPMIANEMKQLAAKARAGKLQPEEYQGGGFSISNLGMYGIKQFNAIINPPQSCILAVGAGQEKPVIQNGKVEVETVMTVTLSCDHRVVDGAVGAELLSAFKRYIEHPVQLFI